MSYQLNAALTDLEAKGKFVNAAGNTECVEFVRQACGAPHTTLWKKGANVMDAATGTITRGTAIATFDEKGHYPTDAKGKHAAVYLGHGPQGIRVMDQWNKQGQVRERVIFNKKQKFPRVNAATSYFIIE